MKRSLLVAIAVVLLATGLLAQPPKPAPIGAGEMKLLDLVPGVPGTYAEVAAAVTATRSARETIAREGEATENATPGDREAMSAGGLGTSDQAQLDELLRGLQAFQKEMGALQLEATYSKKVEALQQEYDKALKVIDQRRSPQQRAEIIKAGEAYLGKVQPVMAEMRQKLQKVISYYAPFEVKAGRSAKLAIMNLGNSFRSALIGQVDTFANLMETALAPCEHLPAGALD